MGGGETDLMFIWKPTVKILIFYYGNYNKL